MPIPTATMDNPNPVIFSSKKDIRREVRSIWIDSSEEFIDAAEEGDNLPEVIDEDEIYDLLRSITDPEHPSTTLEQLGVVTAEQIKISGNHISVRFTPTVPHCGMATLIGLSLRVRLLRSLPARFRVDITVKEGSHQSESALNKQLNDKERVAAALENTTLLDVVNGCLATANLRGRDPIDAA
ncbi:hypothetical protein BS47DRAFT_1325521 [Hydnum rufescens UP504]|uniref:MIP18 family-like domain-containing protein n=1 Tax=Hydnum rufescens UP504 TaxID=1448309 RepID=A0A9P6B5Q6_9AGAM|nr:hypothetical protein BS47DRAFT_1325521 [Hydnum rufescens UP504]